MLSEPLANAAVSHGEILLRERVENRLILDRPAEQQHVLHRPSFVERIPPLRRMSCPRI
jgi:hypothetical protein